MDSSSSDSGSNPRRSSRSRSRSSSTHSSTPQSSSCHKFNIRIPLPPVHRPTHSRHSSESHRAGKTRVRVLYVTNLDEDLNESDICYMFELYGKVKEVRVYYNDQGISTGCADITFVRLKDADKAFAAINRCKNFAGPEALTAAFAIREY